MPAGCWWDAGGMQAGCWQAGTHSPVCCSVRYCCAEWSWHFVSEQAAGSGLLNFSCSPVAPAFPCSAPALCLAGRNKRRAPCALGSADGIAAIPASAPGWGSAAHLSPQSKTKGLASSGVTIVGGEEENCAPV